MTTPAIARLEKLLGTPRDGALLRFSLGMAHAKLENAGKAIEYFRQTVERDAGY